MNSVPKAFRGNDRTISDIQRLFQWSLILAVLSLGGCAVTNKLTSGLKANSERIQCTITLKRTERQMVVEGVANGSHYSRPVTLRFNAVELAGCFFGKFSTNTGSNGALSLKPKGKAKWRLDLIVERVTSKREEQALHDLHGIYVGIVKSDGTLVLKRLPKRSDRRSAQAD